MNRTKTQQNKKKNNNPAQKSTKTMKSGNTKAGKSTKAKKKTSRDSLVPLIIILIILLILVIFLTFSESSSFLSSLFSRHTSTAPEIERPEIIHTEVSRTENPDKDTFSVTTVNPESDGKSGESDSPVVEIPARELKARLFFVKVSDEGQISLKSIIRPVPYDTAPLTETIKSLMLGPDRSDLNNGLLNLIPQKSELLSVRITGGTAFLNFNEDFRYNSLGFEGYKAQLMQIVYTATEFESVDNIQILIAGETYDYLGAEGVFIGTPLDRNHFNTF